MTNGAAGLRTLLLLMLIVAVATSDAVAVVAVIAMENTLAMVNMCGRNELWQTSPRPSVTHTPPSLDST